LARAQALPAQALATLAAFLQTETEGFASPPLAPWRFSFPRDHASHPEHRTEVWRFNGNLVTSEGNRFGFQLSFLRAGIVPPGTPLGPSRFAAREAYWAQFTMTDVQGRRRHDFEQLARAAMQMAGTQASPIRVWVGNWSMQVHDAGAADEHFQLRVAQEDISLELRLRAVKPPVTRAERADSSPGVGRFHGYLLSRLVAQGKIGIGTRSFDVDGAAWLDRAWGELPLPVGAVVWDRFLVQFDDGRELIAVRLRRRDGTGAPLVSAVLVEHNGEARVLIADQLQIEPLERRWRLSLPSEQAEVFLEAPMPQGGPALVRGVASGKPLTGEAHVENAGGR
jgi:predicted secreted hydrolase